MAGNEDWRFRKAQELGLVTQGPVIVGKGDRTAADPAPPKPMSAANSASRGVIASSETHPAVPLSRKLPDRQVPAILWAAAFVCALALAAAAGWWLRGLAAPDPLMTITAASMARGPLTPRSAPPARQPPAAPPLSTEGMVSVPDMAADAPEAASSKPVSAPERLTQYVSPKKAVPPATPRTFSQPAKAEASPRRNTASFNCRRAVTAVNRMICADSKLASLDLTMSQAYRAAINQGDDAVEDRLDREQASFLNARAACETSACIARLTRRRINDLR